MQTELVDHELVLDRVLEAPRAAVWRCWTEPELLRQWFCPRPWRVAKARLDLRPGGAFSTVMEGPAGERVENSGVFLTLEPPSRLMFTDAFRPGWHPVGKPFMVAEIRLEERGAERTRYVATARHWTAEARARHEAMGFHEGWGIAADQLEELAAKL